MIQRCGVRVRALVTVGIGAVLMVVAACGDDRAQEPRSLIDEVVPVEQPVPAKTPSPTPSPVAKADNADSASTYGVHSFCPQICERTRALGCRAADRCDSMCRNAFSDMVCPDTLRPAMDCALSQPIAEWMCSEDGIGAVKDGPCDALQLAYDKCLTAIK